MKAKRMLAWTLVAVLSAMLVTSCASRRPRHPNPPSVHHFMNGRIRLTKKLRSPINIPDRGISPARLRRMGNINKDVPPPDTRPNYGLGFRRLFHWNSGYVCTALCGKSCIRRTYLYSKIF